MLDRILKFLQRILLLNPGVHRKGHIQLTPSNELNLPLSSHITPKTHRLSEELYTKNIQASKVSHLDIENNMKAIDAYYALDKRRAWMTKPERGDLVEKD